MVKTRDFKMWPFKISGKNNAKMSVAHTGFSYGVGTVSSLGPYPEKAPPLFLFSSNLKEGCHLFDTKRFSQEQPHLNAAP